MRLVLGAFRGLRHSKSRLWWKRPCTQRLPTRRTGAREPWLVREVSASRLSEEYGSSTISNRHLTETFKLSRDKRFVEKLCDVVGLYLNPPDKSLVLCVDEKSQIQALDRTQPGLPLKKGRCGTMTHDYKRNGTTTLFASLSMLDGKVIGDCMPRHRHQEFIRFFKKIDNEIPSGLNLHLIVDNYGTHKHPRVQSWLRRHPRSICISYQLPARG